MVKSQSGYLNVLNLPCTLSSLGELRISFSSVNMFHHGQFTLHVMILIMQSISRSFLFKVVRKIYFSYIGNMFAVHADLLFKSMRDQKE